MWNSLIIAVATGVLTLVIATGAAFAISRLKVRGGRTVMNLALLTYFIPAAFLAVPMYKTMGVYGLLNSQWSLILAMMTIATPYAIWVLKQASDKLPLELDEAAKIDGASPMQLFRLVYLPLMMPSLVAVGTYALLLAWNEYLYAFLLLSNDREITLGVALGNFLSSDDSPWELLMTTGPHLRAAAGGDLLRVQALHGRRTHRRRRQELEGIQWQPFRSTTSRSPSAPPRCCTASASTSTTASSSCWSGRRAAASRRSCACSPDSRRSPRGTIAIDGKVVNDVESKDRDIAMVFQSYALYPHMTVADNMAFSLKLRKADAKVIAGARRARVQDPEPRPVPQALSARALRRPAAAGRDGPRDRARSQGVPVRRAAVATSTPSCAWRCAPRSRRCTSG